MADTSSQSLSDEQRARLRERIERRSEAAPATIGRRARDQARLPLSFAQEQLWFLTRLAAEGRAGYAITLSMPLDGPLDPSALRQSLEAIVHRHEALRTVFASDGGGVWQVVLPPSAFDLPVEDLGDDAKAAGAERAAAVRRAESERLFDLSSGPLFRARLVRFEPTRHELIIGVHHIVADGWAIGVLARELRAAYQAFASGRLPVFTELPIQYADYAIWQRAELQGAELERQLSYWRQRLLDAPPCELPTDFARPAVPAFRGASEHAELTPELSAGVRSLAKETRSTLFVTLLAAFKVLLSRHIGTTDLVIGTPVANRTAAEVEPLIGFFVNSVVLRTQLDESATLRETVLRVREVCFSAFEHQGTPFEKLVDALCTDRDSSKNPLFQVAFNVLDGTGSSPELAGVRFGALRGLSESTRFDLEAHVTDLGETLAVDFLYNRGLYTAGTVRELLRQFVRVVEAFVATPGTRVRDVSLLGATERASLVVEGTGAAGPDPGGMSLGARLLAGVAAYGDAIAVEDGATRWTYAALGRRATQLAGVLRRHGVGPNVVVGVWQERNADLLGTLAGITVAGGAYLPLDPGQPAARATAALTDTGARVVVTTAALAATVPAGPWTVVTLEAVATAPIEPVGAMGTADDLAYVLFTSGSTGAPKGVAVPQRAVVRLVVGADYVRLGPATVLGQAATAAFDAATFEVWGAWLHGGRLVVIPAAVAVAPAALGAYLQRTGVTTLFLTTALVHQIGREAPGALAGLDTLLFGGEAVEPRWVAAIQAAGGPRRVHHVYGPTENTTFSTWAPVGPVAADAVTIPIGGPIAQSSCYVVDGHGALVPVGVPGELLVGGEGLATGYVGAPRLTAERFVPDGHSGIAGARVYRTGDVVRWTAPGVLTFVGRRDGQIKLRGYRIELGEVETALRGVAGVGAAVVIVRGTGTDRQLVGYVEPVPGAALTGAAVRDALKGTLPAYMVPATVVVLDALPLNANGKVDRRALPDPVRLTPGLATAGAAAPRSVVEGQIAAVWREVLGLDAVGLDESFFDVGGHSLLLVRVQAGLETALGRAVPLVTLFQYPTIAALAAHLGADDVAAVTPTPAASRAVDAPIAVIGRAGRFPGAPDVETLWAHVRVGEELLRRFTPEELAAAGVPAALTEDARYVPVRGVLRDVEQFDAGLFGMTPRDAALLDPQQRVLLECAWTALEDAGYGPQTRRDERIGIWAGTSANTYVARANRRALAEAGALQVLVASDKDFLATRVSYKLDLGGPAVTVQTACSTSLVAVHLACQALRALECEVALAGGVSITVPPGGYMYQPEGIASPDGHCRPFDAAAQGTVAGNGVGVVVLKPLAAAVRDGDTVHAVIRGSAINNDGADKVGFTAPSVHGQAAVIRAAQAAAGIEATSIGYVEAHGTGTTLGDPIEVAALRQVFGDGAGPGTCGLASVKGSIGHLDAAAGVTGLLVAIEAVKAGEVPATAHFRQANPQLALGPFVVSGTPQVWPSRGAGRRAGVSSFGMGGTNAHVVLEEAPAVAPVASACGALGPWQVVPVSGQTAAAVATAARQLADFLESHAAVALADVAYTQQVGRAALGVRRVAVGTDAATLAAALRTAGDHVAAPRPPVVWVFPGQGTQMLRMGEALYRAAPVFRAELDACASVLAPLLGGDLRAILYPEVAAETAAAAQLATTAWTQVALVAVELALAAQWRAWGVTPDAVAGHSVGEVAAACVAGVLTRDAALTLAATRGQAMGAAPAGGMLAVLAGVDAVTPHLGADLWLAAVNRATQVVVAGAAVALARAETALAAAGIRTQRLAAAGAFHSGLMAGAVGPLDAVALTLPHTIPQLPWISTVTGAAVPEGDATYWGRQVTAPVQWVHAVQTAAATVGGPAVWLEVGPGHTLTHLVRGTAPVAVTVASLDRHGADAAMARALGALWGAGVTPDWAAVHAPATPRRIPLPTYPFQRQRFWLDAEPSHAIPDDVIKRANVAEWLYQPCWKQTPAPVPSVRRPSRCVLFVDDDLFGTSLRDEFAGRNLGVVTVHAGAGWSQRGPGAFTIDPRDVTAYRRVFDTALGDGDVVVVHAWSVGGGQDLDRTLDRAFFSALRVVQALASHGADAHVRVTFVTDRMQIVRGDETVAPAKATLRGLRAVAALEHPDVPMVLVDIEAEAGRDSSTAARVADEVLSSQADVVVAHRGRRRWVQTFEPLPPRAGTSARASFVAGATYLITGGSGRIGLAIARHLVGRVGARVILASRHASSHVGEMRALGLGPDSVHVLDIDVADETAFAAALSAAERKIGPVRGVVHAAATTATADFELITEADVETCRRQFRSKINGTAALDGVLRDRTLDFCILMSSISTVLGGVGFAAYAAGNAFMDAFAEGKASNDVFEWTSVAWDGWRFDATAVATTEAARLAMTAEEGVAVLERVLGASDGGCVVVSTANLAWREARLRARATPGAGAPVETSLAAPRPSVATAYAAPRSDTERVIAEAWQSALGITQVGMHDNFLELGGHSLLGVQLMASLGTLFGTRLSLRDLWESPTVAELAAKVELQGTSPQGTMADRVSRALASVMDLSEEEIERRLGEQ